jgi:predicted Abi (CAAX) family protease
MGNLRWGCWDSSGFDGLIQFAPLPRYSFDGIQLSRFEEFTAQLRVMMARYRVATAQVLPPSLGDFLHSRFQSSALRHHQTHRQQVQANPAIVTWLRTHL